MLYIVCGQITSENANVNANKMQQRAPSGKGNLQGSWYCGARAQTLKMRSHFVNGVR